MPDETPSLVWTRYAQERLVGRRIVEVRYLTEEEMQALMWYRRSLVLVLDDGSMLFASADDEGNDAGALFGASGLGEQWTFPVLRGK